MSYSDLLKDPGWQKKRLEILQRDNFACRICDSKDRTLHVHHWYYAKDRLPWDYDDSCFVTVCDECHEHSPEIHGYKLPDTEQRTPVEELITFFNPLNSNILVFGCEVMSAKRDGLIPNEDEFWIAMALAVRTPEVLSQILSQCSKTYPKPNTKTHTHTEGSMTVKDTSLT